MASPFPGGFDSIALQVSGSLITSAFINSLVNAINAIEQAALGLNPQRGICEGRLTLTTGVPVPTEDVTDATTIYYTVYVGNRIALFDGTINWNVVTFTADLSVALGTLVASTTYDVFAYNADGTATLEIGPAWTDASTRSVPLAMQDGIPVLSTDATRRYLGSFTTMSTTTTSDSLQNRLLYNAVNQVSRPILAQNVAAVATGASSWTPLSGTTATFVLGQTGAAPTFAAIANAGAHSTLGTVSSFGVGVNSGNPSDAAFCTVAAPLASAPFCMTPPTVAVYPTLGQNSLSAFAMTGAASLTVTNPGVSGLVQL